MVEPETDGFRPELWLVVECGVEGAEAWGGGGGGRKRSRTADDHHRRKEVRKQLSLWLLLSEIFTPGSALRTRDLWVPFFFLFLISGILALPLSVGFFFSFFVSSKW